MQRLLIGDIHGCLDELEALLYLSGLGEGDEVIALSDIVDRGSNAPGVFTTQPDKPGRLMCQSGPEARLAQPGVCPSGRGRTWGCTS